MAIYTIEADGKQFDIEGPDNATQDELQGAVDAHMGGASSQPQEKGMLEKGYDILNTPRRGIQMLTDVTKNALPETGQSTSVAKNIAVGLPRYLTEVGGEAAADLVHPVNLVTAGLTEAAGPALKLARAGVPLIEEAAPGVAKVARTILAPTVKNAGKAIGAAERAAGIDVTEEAVNAPRTRKAIISFANRLKDVVKNPELANQVDAKTLNALKGQTGDILDFLKVAREGATPKQLVSKGTIARLSQIKDALSSAVSTAEPAVGEALKDFAASKGRQAALRTLGGAVKTGTRIAAGGTAAGAALKYLFR